MGAGVSSSQVLRAVLKQYAFSPDKYQAEVVHRALIKVRLRMAWLCFGKQVRPQL